MGKLWMMAAGLLCAATVSCSNPPEEVVIGAETPAEAGESSGDASAANDLAGEPWINPRDAAITTAGGTWAERDFEFDDLPVGVFSAPIEITALTDAELTDCLLLDSVFWSRSPADIEARAYSEDGAELAQQVLDRGGDATRMLAAFTDYSQRCEVFEIEGDVITVHPLDVDFDSAVFALRILEDDEVSEVWVSIMARQNVISLLALVGPTNEFPAGDRTEFERLVGLQFDALASAPVTQIEGRVADYRTTTMSDTADDAGDVVDEAISALEAAQTALAEAEVAKAKAEAEAALAEAKGAAAD